VPASDVRREELIRLIAHIPEKSFDAVLLMLNTFIPKDNENCEACKELRQQKEASP
jgi:hypothetical protein